LKIAPAALYTGVALLGATAGFLSFRHYMGAQPRMVAIASPTPAPAAAATAASAVANADSAALAIPEEVPDIKLADMGGTPRALRAIPGRTRLFNFWASWCEPCRREIPLLNTLQSAHKAEGLQIVGIAVDMRADVQTFLKVTPLHYTVLVGEEGGAEAAQKFGMQLLLPFSVFADQHNRIVAVKVGEMHRDEADAILAHMESLATGKESLQAARTAIAGTLRTLAIERSKQSPRT
jgi:thiol-disulfide isomerase/thioredoxin